MSNRLPVQLLLVLLLLAAAWRPAQAVSCSSFMGQASINELRIGTSGRSKTNNQVELFNSANLAQADWQRWRIVVRYGRNTYSYTLSSGFTNNGQFIYNNNKSIYLRNKNGSNVDVTLQDASGNVIDYLAIEGRVQSPPACFGSGPIVNATSTAKRGASGDIPRLPDAGSWPSNVSNTTSHTIGRSNNCSLGGNDLEVRNSVDITDPIINSTQVNYEISVTNSSCSGSVSNIQITDSNINTSNFSGLTYSQTQGSTSQSGNNRVWSVGTLTYGNTATLSISGTPKNSGTLTTTASITTPASGLINTDDDSDPVSINVRDYNYVGFDLTADSVTEGIDDRYSANISASFEPDKKITINYTVSGTAGASDTNLASGSVTIDPASDPTDSVSIDFTIKNDAIHETVKTIILTITSISSQDSTVRLDDPAKVMTITLEDDDLPPIIADYRFDTGTAMDSSANHLHGSLNGGVSTGVAGKICTGYRFNGSNAFVSVPHNSLLNLSNITVGAWVKHDSNAFKPWEAILAKGDSAYRLHLNGGCSINSPNIGNALSLGINSGCSTADVDSGVIPTANQWTHVMGTYDGSTIKIYVNGVLRASAAYAGAIASNGFPLYIGENPEQTGRYWSGDIDEVKIFGSALSASEIAAGYANENGGNNWDGSGRTCVIPSTGPAALNAVDTGAHAVTGKISTKKAGSAFNLDIYALNAARTAQDMTASGAVLLDLLANTSTGTALDGNNCPVSGTALSVGSATLSAGKVVANIPAIANAWRDVRVRMRYPATGTPTIVACSSDNFAVKPAALSAIASHADWQSAGTGATLANTAASGGELHKAGQSFTLRVSAYNAGNQVTSNYDGNPTASITCILPSSDCVTGVLSTGALNFSAGTALSNTASYSEVGVISASFSDSAYASVDSTDTAASCAGYYVCSSAINIGRFVPDHFDIASNAPAFTPACSGFTYQGQAFGLGTAPVWSITARTSTGATTRNYTGSLFKITAGTVTGQTWSAASGALSVPASLPAVGVSDLGNGVGGLTFSVGNPAAGGGLSFVRATPSTPFDASLTLAASVADSEGVSHAGNPYQHAGIGFDDGNAATVRDAEMRFGRLRISNASGSEYRALPVQLTAQYWNGQGFVTNAADNCTVLAAPSPTFFAQSADNHLASGETTASFNSTLVTGNANLQLSAPGVGNFGFLDLTVNAPAWLKFNWDGVDQAGDADLFDDNPHARAVFGKRSGSNQVIIRREIF